MITEERVMLLLAECNPVPDVADLDLSGDLATTRLTELDTRSREMAELKSEHSATTPAFGRHRLIVGAAAAGIVIVAVVLLQATDRAPVAAPGLSSDTQLDQLEYEADVDLIVDLWRGHSDSWSTGVGAGYAHAAENDYPAMECSKDDMQGLYRYDDGRINVMVVHTETIARDDGWESPELGGAVPDGRIYIHQITHTYYEADFPMGSSDLSVEHTTVIGDRAYFFIPCH